MGEIDVKKISMCYGKFCALENVSFKIESNKIYGLLGRNGAGKTTLLNLITNRLFPTDGEITIDGEGVKENDNAIGKIYYMTEKDLFPESMKVKDVFYWTKEFYPNFDFKYVSNLCEKFDLNPNKKFKSLSKGYNTIAKLITALSTNSSIIIFDEPVIGLDANHRDLFYKELLANFVKQPKTIIISTHIIEEIANMLDRVIILNNKKVQVDDSTENLLKSAYCVSGSSENIDKYILGKKCIDIEKMASFKSATIQEKLTDTDRKNAQSLKLELTKLELQKLFIYLTGTGGVNQ